MWRIALSFLLLVLIHDVNAAETGATTTAGEQAVTVAAGVRIGRPLTATNNITVKFTLNTGTTAITKDAADYIQIKINPALIAIINKPLVVAANMDATIVAVTAANTAATLKTQPSKLTVVDHETIQFNDADLFTNNGGATIVTMIFKNLLMPIGCGATGDSILSEVKIVTNSAGADSSAALNFSNDVWAKNTKDGTAYLLYCDGLFSDSTTNSVSVVSFGVMGNPTLYTAVTTSTAFYVIWKNTGADMGSLDYATLGNGGSNLNNYTVAIDGVKTCPLDAEITITKDADKATPAAALASSTNATPNDVSFTCKLTSDGIVIKVHPVNVTAKFVTTKFVKMAIVAKTYLHNCSELKVSVTDNRPGGGSALASSGSVPACANVGSSNQYGVSVTCGGFTQPAQPAQPACTACTACPACPATRAATATAALTSAASALDGSILMLAAILASQIIS